MISKKDIRSLNEQEFKDILILNSFKPFRANQIFHWLWKKSVYSFYEMTNLPDRLIEFLEKNFIINNFKLH